MARDFTPAAQRLGLSGIRFHDLRHTGNTLAAATGASLADLMARMGHASADAALLSLSQRELAERAGTTQSAVARLESGRTSPSFDTVLRLVRLCGLRLDVALDDDDDADVAQAEALLRLTVDERVDHVLSAVAFAAEVRAAHRAAVDA